MSMDVQRMKDELLLKQGGVKANVTPMGFYSPLEEAAYKIQRKAGNAQAFMNDLRTVPKDQLQHAGVDKLLTSKPTLTREEVQQHISQAAPRVDVVMRRKPDLSSLYEERPGVYRLRGRENIGWFRNPQEAEEHLSEGTATPQYEEYTLPGGNNYREMLLTLPENKPSVSTNGWTATLLRPKSPVTAKPEFEIKDQNGNVVSVIRTADDSRKAINLAASQLYENKKRSVNYRTHHWEEPNVLAHIRMNDRTDPDGKKVLFVEEIQSDWGQEGKKKGFASGDWEAPYREWERGLRERAKSFFLDVANTPEEREAAKRMGEKLAAREDLGSIATVMGERPQMSEAWNKALSLRNRAPAAPFVTKTNDWVNLALKHILKTAAQEGHDKVAFVRGDQAADRFGLDKQFSSIEANPVGKNAYELRTTQKDGTQETSVNVPHDKLHEYVGEDLAKKIHDQGGGYFEGDNLKMPQKGIRKFYDELVPAQAQGLISKLGGKMGTVGVQVPPASAIYPERTSLRETSYHPGFEITPQMRQAILKPMSYKVGGAVPAMDAMRLKVWGKRSK